jgi:N-dimethylarginine dimethylaminohydrolase
MNTAMSHASRAAATAVRHFALCEPDHFAIEDEINPWMHRSIQPCRERCRIQWRGLLRTLRALGATVDVLPAVAGLPDMVFARDGGVVLNGHFIRGRFRYTVRQPETSHYATWLERLGCPTVDLALRPDACLEGGDVCVFDGSVLAGWGYRSNRAAHEALSERLGVGVRSLRLVAPSLYHLDMCLCPLDDRHALVAPDALDADSIRVVEEVVPEPLELDLEEALTFCANAIVLDRTVVMSECPLRLRALLERHGFDVCVTPVGEFTKSGGAVSCLTLPLDRSVRCAL